MNSEKWIKCHNCGYTPVVLEQKHGSDKEYDICPGCEAKTCCGRPNPVWMEDCGLYCQTCYDRFFDQTSVEYNPYFTQEDGDI